MIKFREIRPTVNGWNRASFSGQKISPASQTVATARNAPKICQGQPPTMYTKCSRFHSNRFTFGGVIAESVNTTKRHRKVNAIFGWSVTLSRIMTALSSGSVLYVRCDRRATGYTPYCPCRHRVETVNTPRLPATDREYIGLLPG